MDIFREIPIKRLRTAIALVAVCATLVLAQDAPKQVTKSEALAAIAFKVQPEYPPIARQLKIQGTVELMVLVSESGAVKKVDVLSGNPVLTGPATVTVKGWKFKPFLEEGKAIQVLAPISLDFKL